MLLFIPNLNILIFCYHIIFRLKTLELPDILTFTWELAFQLSALEYLTTLNVDVTDLGLSFCEFLVPILDIVPKLRHLEVTVDKTFGQIDDNVVNKLSTSSLQSLRVNCPVRGYHGN